MSTLLFARHAQSVANVGRWISGWTEIDLTADGVRQARGLADRVREEPLAGILASDLLRARHTAEIVADHLQLPVVFDDGLRERNYGAWTGLPYDALAAQGGTAFGETATDPTFMPPGGESLKDHRARALDALARGRLRFGTKPVLVVAHQGTLRVLLQHLHGVTGGEPPFPPDPPDVLRVEWPDRALPFLSHECSA